MKNQIRTSRLLLFVLPVFLCLTEARGQIADTLLPVDDTYSLLTTPTITMGADVLLRVRSPLVTNSDQTIWRTIYLKFDLRTYGGSIDSAKLRLGAVQIVLYPGGKNAVDIYAIDDDSWRTSSLTWNNAPPKGKYQFSQDLVPRTTAQQTTYGDTAYYFNITNMVKSEYAGDKIVSLCLTNDSLLGTDARFRSTRATSGIRPLLVIYKKTTAVGASESATLPTGFDVKQNYPNPFNPTTTIAYSIPRSGHVKISIYDVIGAEVRTISDRVESPGFKELRWDARSNDGRQVPSGVYFCRIRYEEAVQSMKMMLMK